MPIRFTPTPPTRTKAQVYRTRRGRVMDRPPGTRCYVPGFQDSATQFEIDQQQLGVAPIAAGMAVAKAGGLRISFKKGSPRYMGGPLVRTVDAAMQRVASGDTATITKLNQLRQGIGTDKKGKRAWQGVWVNELPKQPLTTAQYTLIKQYDSSLPVSPPAVVTGPAPALPPPPTAQPTIAPPAPPQVIWPWAPAPSPAPAPAPVVITMPVPPESLPGGEAPVTQPTEPVKAGLFGGGQMATLAIVGFGALLLTQLTGKRR